MTATNHALTGSVIGLAVGQPWLAVPLALLSHFVCDALPHYGAGSNAASTARFKKMLILDTFGCFLVVLVLAIFQPQFWLLAAFCAFVAASPDFMWVKRFLRAQRGEAEDPTPPILLRFHAKIQWFEKPSGIYFEIAWAVAAMILLKLIIV